MKKARILIHKKTHAQWFITDFDTPFYTPHGPIALSDLDAKHGATVISKRGEEFVILDANQRDVMEHFKRKAQVILPKDAGYILAMTGVTDKSVIVDAGAGSGWLTCFLAQYAKKVICCDINKEHLKVATTNAKMLGLKNIEFMEYDIYEGPPVSCDIMTLDVPEPWKVLPKHKKLKVGGYIICYTPNITQALEAVNAAKECNCMVLRTDEVLLHGWDLDGKRARRLRDEIGPTGFISVLRKI